MQHLRYRPDIDGLRAIAVLSVLIYHAGISLPGGFVGVDIFFVISGYLITALLSKELEASGKISLLDFWERRARRIIPALAALVLTVLIAGFFLLLPEELEALGRSAMAQAFFVANIFFWRASGYFEGPADQMPLLHTWSLAVEEQFYLFFPAILVLLFKIHLFRKRHFLLLILSTAFLASLILSEIALRYFVSASFYLLPTRAWELLAGSLLALAPPHWKPPNRAVRELASISGLFLIMGSLCLLSKASAFPGFAAVPSCLGAALIIWAGHGYSSPITSHPSILSRLLGSAPLVFIGQISYSLYLWHWPPVAFTHYWLMKPIPLWGGLLIVAGSFALAFLSWRFVETPFRKRQFCSSRTSMFRFAAISLVLIFGVGFCYWATTGLPWRFNHANILLENWKEAREKQVQTSDIERENLPRLGNPHPASGAPRLLVWGDSHARRCTPALDDLAKKAGFTGWVITINSTSPFLDGKQPDFQKAVLSFAESHHLRNVLLIAYWRRDLDPRIVEESQKKLLSTIEQLNAKGAKVFILLQPPEYQTFVPRLILKKKLLGQDYREELTTPHDYYQLHQPFYELARNNQNPNAVYLESAPYFLDESLKQFLIEDHGQPLYTDKHHLSDAGSRKILEKIFREQLLPRLQRNE